MALRIITTVGTSIFSNYQKRETADKLEDKYQSINDLVDKLDKLGASEYGVSRWKSAIRNLKERIEFLWLPFAEKKSSAEIETLYKIAEEEKQDLEVYLLATDTILSVVACELIKEWFDKYPSVTATNEQILRVKCHFNGDINASDTTIVRGLQVQNAKTFETQGFENLLKIITKYIEKKNTILNISGGYKAVIPYLTLFAQLNEIPLKYAYEDSGTLMTVGNLPFSFDFSFFTDEYLAFETIKPDKAPQNLPSKNDFIENLSAEKEFEKLKNSHLIEEKDSKIQLSGLGKILYEKYEASEKEDGFSSSNLLGKVMEIKVYEFLQKEYPNSTNLILGKGVGTSSKGHAYDIDVFLETPDVIWAIEVKPLNIDVLMTESMTEKKKMETLEYKCQEGAFKNAKAIFDNQKLNLAIVMYHHKEPHKFQVEAFKKLKDKYNYLRWVWLKPTGNYKGNVNWSADISKFKEFNFQSNNWDNFSFKNKK